MCLKEKMVCFFILNNFEFLFCDVWGVINVKIKFGIWLCCLLKWFLMFLLVFLILWIELNVFLIMFFKILFLSFFWFYIWFFFVKCVFFVNCFFMYWYIVLFYIVLCELWFYYLCFELYFFKFEFLGNMVVVVWCDWMNYVFFFWWNENLCFYFCKVEYFKEVLVYRCVVYKLN